MGPQTQWLLPLFSTPLVLRSVQSFTARLDTGGSVRSMTSFAGSSSEIHRRISRRRRGALRRRRARRGAKPISSLSFAISRRPPVFQMPLQMFIMIQMYCELPQNESVMSSALLLSAINKTLDDKKKGCASVTQLLDFSPRALANLFYCSPIISETESALLVSTDLSPIERRRCVVT